MRIKVCKSLAARSQLCYKVMQNYKKGCLIPYGAKPCKKCKMSSTCTHCTLSQQLLSKPAPEAAQAKPAHAQPALPNIKRLCIQMGIVHFIFTTYMDYGTGMPEQIFARAAL